MPALDVEISNHGSCFIFEPITEKGSTWLVENAFGAEVGKPVVVEHKNAYNLFLAALEDKIKIK